MPMFFVCQHGLFYKIHSQARHTAHFCVSLLLQHTTTDVFIKYLPKTFSQHSPSWRRYTFLSHLRAKSQISARWIKKLVAVTDGVYLNLFLNCLYTCVYLYLMRRDVARRYKQRNHIQQ